MACPLGPIGGGMSRVVDYLIAAQAASGAQGPQLVALDTRGNGSAARSLWVLLGAMQVLVAAHRRSEVAGVHIHMAERLSLLRKSALMLLCKSLGIPMILHLHAAQFPQFYRKLPVPARWLTRMALRLPQSVVVLGQHSRRFMTEELAVAPGRVSVVFNGVPEPLLPRRRVAGQVLFVGNLSERKGVGDLLRALCLAGWDTQHTRVCLAGGGDVQAYQAKAQAMGLGHWVQWTGWLGQSQVAERMAQADVLVLPSYDEGLPLVILEAMAQGVAVVCTPVGEIPLLIEDERHALFVRPGDIQALARQIQRVLTDDELRARLENAGRQLYARRFSMSRFSREIARLHSQHFEMRPRT